MLFGHRTSDNPQVALLQHMHQTNKWDVICCNSAPHNTNMHNVRSLIFRK